MAWDTLSQVNSRYNVDMTEVAEATLQDLADRMGEATPAEAQALKTLLLAEGYATFAEIGEAAWHRLHEQAVNA